MCSCDSKFLHGFIVTETWLCPQQLCPLIALVSYLATCKTGHEPSIDPSWILDNSGLPSYCITILAYLRNPWKFWLIPRSIKVLAYAKTHENSGLTQNPRHCLVISHTICFSSEVSSHTECWVVDIVCSDIPHTVSEYLSGILIDRMLRHHPIVKYTHETRDPRVISIHKYKSVGIYLFISISSQKTRFIPLSWTADLSGEDRGFVFIILIK